MLALLRKDCYVMGKYTVTFILAWVVMAGMYAWISNVERSALFYLMPVMGSTISLNAVSNDQECRWDLFAAMTPLRPWELVLEKYLFAYGVLALLAGLGALAGWVSTLGKGSLDICGAAVGVSLLIVTALPVVYRFGRKKGGLIIMALWGLVAAAIFWAAYWRYPLIEAAFGWIEAVPGLVMAAGCIIVLGVLNFCSVLLSIRFYTRRQRGWYD